MTGTASTFAGKIYASNDDPAYSFASDTTTGLSRTGTNQMAFKVGGTQTLELAADLSATFAGTITGTTATFVKDQNADSKIQLYNANAGAAAEATIYVTNSSAASAGLFLGTAGTGTTTAGGFIQDGCHIGSGSNASGGLSIMTRAAADMRFYTNGHTNERMRIDAASGDVTIIAGYGGGTYPLRVGYGSYASFTPTFSIADTGNVKIGTATTITPATQADDLVIDNGATESGITIVSTSAGGIRFGDAASASIGSIEYGHSSNTMSFGTNGSTALTINSAGNLGLGTTDPTSDAIVRLIEIENATSAGIAFDATGARKFSLYSSSSSTFALRDETAGANRLIVAAGGEIGIGGAPVTSRTLSIYNTSANNELEFQGTDYTNIYSQTTSQMALEVLGAGGTLKLATTGGHMTIDADGNAGIGNGFNNTNAERWQFLSKPTSGGACASNGGSGYFAFGDGYSTDDAILMVRNDGDRGSKGHASGSSLFKAEFNDGNTAMDINKDGTVMFGKTNANVDTVGHRFDSDGASYTSITTSDGTHYVRDTTTSLYRFYVTGGGVIYATNTSISSISDVTLKENIKPLETGLDEILKLQPRRFDWKNGDGKNIAGFVAQEVEEVLPDLVSDAKYTDEETKKSLKMGDMIPTLVKAVQELKAEVDELKKNCNCK